MAIVYSALDQSPIRKGQSPAQALHESTALAQQLETLGYHRYWLSEHHNTTALAGSVPEILISHIAGATSTLRVGSGGIMLPNHSALKVAESFNMLTALYGPRIDLGIGRAPGTDRRTAALLNPSNNFTEQEFIEKLTQLQSYFINGQCADSFGHASMAVPHSDNTPEQWLLSSSGQSAVFAAYMGMGLSFAQFINPNGAAQAVQYYKQHFTPGYFLKEPQAMVCIFAFCSNSDEKVKQQQAVMLHRFLMLEKRGRLDSITYADIENYPYDEDDRARMQANAGRMITGNPKQMQQQLTQLQADTGVTELMFICYADNYEDRLESYKLLADVCKRL